MVNFDSQVSAKMGYVFQHRAPQLHLHRSFRDETNIELSAPMKF